MIIGSGSLESREILLLKIPFHYIMNKLPFLKIFSKIFNHLGNSITMIVKIRRTRNCCKRRIFLLFLFISAIENESKIEFHDFLYIILNKFCFVRTQIMI